MTLKPSTYGFIYTVLVAFLWGLIVPLAFGLMLGGCDGCGASYSDSHLSTMTSYRVDPTRVTPDGTQVTDRMNEIDLASLDRAIKDTADCLATASEPAAEESAAMECLFSRLRRTVNRAAFDVLVAPDWYASTCTGQEMFPCVIPDSVCQNKTELNGLPCPCACRATVQQNRTIVIVPSAAPTTGLPGPERDVFRGELIRLVTGCNNIWRGPLAACAQN